MIPADHLLACNQNDLNNMDGPEPSDYMDTFLVKRNDRRSLKLSTAYEFEDDQSLNMEVVATSRKNRIQSYLTGQAAG